MNGFVAFGTQFLSLTQCVIALAMLWVYLPPRGRQMLQVTTVFWPAALVLAAFKGALFAWGAAYGESMVLTVGNMCNVASCVFMALTAARWTRPVSRGLLVSLLVVLAGIGFLYEIWRRDGAATFVTRLYLISSLLVIVPAWMAVELWRIDRHQRSIHLRLALGMAVVVALANLYRMGATAALDVGAASNILNEPVFLFAARIIILAALTLLPLLFQNAFFERLLQQESDAREHHRHLFDAMPAAGLIFDDQGRITRWNHEAERLLGWDAEQALGRDVVDMLFSPQEATRARELLQPALPVARNPLARDRRDALATLSRLGQTVECEWVCRPMSPQSSDSQEVVAVVIDVSEQRQRERRAEQDRVEALDRESALSHRLVRVQGDLKDLRSDLAVAADAAHIGMWVEQVGSGFTLSLRCGEIFGVVAAKVRSYSDLLQRFHPEDRPQATALHELLTAKGRCVWEARVLRGEGAGQIGWVSIWAQGERTVSGKLQRVRAIVLDITERREAESELQQRRRELAHLARVNTLGELAGGFAHELNQPLTAILGNAEAGMRMLQSGEAQAADLEDILQDIIDQDRRATEVIRRLRRLVATGEVREDLVEIASLVEASVSLLSSEVQSHQVVLSTDCVQGLRARGDEVQLQQVLMNLVVNALEALKHRDPLSRRLRIVTRPHEGHQVQLSICDSGHGLPPAGEEQIFQPFFSTKPDGLGLGLSICRTIVEAHRGRIQAAPAAEGGACITVTLPAAD